MFYGAPESPDGTLRLPADGPTEQTITADLTALAPSVRKVVIAAALDGAPTVDEVGAIQVTAGRDNSARPLAQPALDAATTQRTMLLAERCRRGPVWRLRVIGQGYDDGLDGLVRGYGVDVEE
ncbi:TerD family protein [Streptomyces sp. NPDC048434]|uniref:TerD family protein n=1 Tax=Streptomyces sp. NPDC048434 TaxID=3365549 RepID=UPI00372007BD